MVEVLLATFNGERYLREQIDSILGQDTPDLNILAWDDGSTDRTVTILNEYAALYPDRVRVCSGGNPTGHPKRNFLRLMKASTADYVCFADQDDVWLPGKVSLTLQAMRRLEERYGTAIPLLVFTDLRVVDDALKTLHPSLWKQAGVRVRNIHSLPRMLGENTVTGCTAMLNRSMYELAREMPEEAYMHDWWIALLATTFGQAEGVPQCTVLYRQHGYNVVGSPKSDTSIRGLASRAWNNNSRRLGRIKSELQAEAFLQLHGKQMKPSQQEIVEAYVRRGQSNRAWKRIAITVRYGFYRSGILRNLTTILEMMRARAHTEKTSTPRNA